MDELTSNMWSKVVEDGKPLRMQPGREEMCVKVTIGIETRLGRVRTLGAASHGD